MNNFRFTKIIASVSPILAKETVLSKIINMVDAFTITLSYGFDDNNKKYIDTLMKLDNSKTIIIETKGNEIRVKNTVDIPVKKGQKIIVDYSEYTQDGDKKIYIDYAHLNKLPIGASITFEQSQVVLKVEKKKEDYAECSIAEGGIKKILQYDRVTLEHNEEEISSLLEKDKKDILRGLEYGAHAIALSACYDAAHITTTRAFLKEQHNSEMKIFAKIETQHGIDNLNEIADEADGIIFIVDILQPLLGKQTLQQCIDEVRRKGVPVLISYITKLGQKTYPLAQENTIKEMCNY
jgi:pyruvate kinase